ncbi:MAG: hypothetical protein DRP74_01215 [Candidatus Omnitrophota bacterium]|nr:MAG: hypothetical protein DRP74_01215 [Candidatus Omnitrophota bacterium]
MLKHKKLTYLFISIFLFVLLAVSFIRQQYVVPILMYHSVRPDAEKENRLAVSAESFKRQMQFLKKFNYNVLPLDELAKLIREKKTIPMRTVAITFDDGYKDNYKFAFPVLKEYQIPATVFLIVNEIGRSQNDRLSWQEIREMRGSGLVDFGSHCLGPEPLVNFTSDSKIQKEILLSKKILERKLGIPIAAFSYPEGRFSEKIKNMVRRAGYELAVVTSPGKRYPDDDVFLLKRLRISSTSDNLFVFWLESSGFYTFIKEHRDDD